VTLGETIRRLLSAGEKVILPGFGTLEIVEAGTGVPDSAKRLDPPGRKITFDGSFSKDDGRLAAAFSSDTSVDAEEAGQQVLELVDAIRFALDKGDKYSLEGAGTFTRDDDGKVRFSADRDWVIEPDQYGLESMELLELEEEVSEEEEEVKEETVTAQTVQPEPVRTQPPPPSIEKEEPEYYEPWKKDKSHRKSRTWKIIWGVAGFLIIVLLVLILVPEERLSFLGGKEKPVTNESMTGGSAEDSESGQPGETKTTVSPAGPAETGPAVKETPQVDVSADNEPVPIPAHKFFLVAGSFRNLANASELQDKLKDRGYAAEVMMTENRMYRVTAASYATRGEAERALTRIRTVPGLESCWLLSN
jgi:cell division septation protein DedD